MPARRSSRSTTIRGSRGRSPATCAAATAPSTGSCGPNRVSRRWTRCGEMKLRGDAVALLLADYRMPQMTGIEFLEQAMDLYPGARRVLLTAYADTDAAIDAINVVDLDHYLLKPWDPPEEKLYPVARRPARGLARDRPPAGARDQSGRAPVVGPLVAGPRVPGPQPGALPLVPLATTPRASGCWPRPAPTTAPAGGDHRRRRTPWSSRPTPSWPARVGLDTTPAEQFYDLVVDRRRPGRPRRGGLRRLRGPAHRTDRAHRGRGPGRAELADRELPRLPRRRVRRAAHRPGPAAGAQVRRRTDHHPRGGRHSRSTGSARTVRFADGDAIDAHAVILATGVSYRQLAAPGHWPS